MIAAEGEQKASRALREAANVIAESSSALQVFKKSNDFHEKFENSRQFVVVVQFHDNIFCQK